MHPESPDYISSDSDMTRHDSDSEACEPWRATWTVNGYSPAMATDGSVGASLFHKVEYLSLARNRFVGSTEALDGSSLLKTLILNDNYFSCPVTPVTGLRRLFRCSIVEQDL